MGLYRTLPLESFLSNVPNWFLFLFFTFISCLWMDRYSYVHKTCCNEIYIYHISAKFSLLDYCNNIKVIFLITSNPISSFSIIQCIIINCSHHSLYKISWTLSCHYVFFLHKPHPLLATIILHLISIEKGFLDFTQQWDLICFSVSDLFHIPYHSDWFIMTQWRFSM